MFVVLWGGMFPQRRLPPPLHPRSLASTPRCSKTMRCYANCECPRSGAPAAPPGCWFDASAGASSDTPSVWTSFCSRCKSICQWPSRRLWTTLRSLSLFHGALAYANVDVRPDLQGNWTVFHTLGSGTRAGRCKSTDAGPTQTHPQRTFYTICTHSRRSHWRSPLFPPLPPPSPLRCCTLGRCHQSDPRPRSPPIAG